jgi:hypothetical protein
MPVSMLLSTTHFQSPNVADSWQHTSDTRIRSSNKSWHQTLSGKEATSGSEHERVNNCFDCINTEYLRKRPFFNGTCLTMNCNGKGQKKCLSAVTFLSTVYRPTSQCTSVFSIIHNASCMIVYCLAISFDLQYRSSSGQTQQHVCEQKLS